MFEAPQMLYIGLIGGNADDLSMPEINQRLSFNPRSQPSSNFFPLTAKWALSRIKFWQQKVKARSSLVYQTVKINTK